MSEGAPAMRAGDEDRSRCVQTLQRHYQAGRLTLAELEDRTRQAYAARTLAELTLLTVDLPPEPPPATAARQWSGRARCACGPRSISEQVRRYGCIMLLLTAIWAVSGRGYFWPIWPMLGWGFALAMRASRSARSGDAVVTLRRP